MTWFVARAPLWLFCVAYAALLICFVLVEPFRRVLARLGVEFAEMDDAVTAALRQRGRA